MVRPYTFISGLIVSLVASAPLVAQEPSVPLAALAAQEKRMFLIEYVGTGFTPGERAAFIRLDQEGQGAQREMHKRLSEAKADSSQRRAAMDSLQRQLDDRLYASLTPEQQQVVARNRQVLEVYYASDKLSRRVNDDRERILMGVNLTDPQLASVKKILDEEPGKLRAAGLDPRSTIPPAVYKVRGQVADALYALLTATQQQVAASAYERLKGHYAQLGN
jgi:hypothetical protein